mmetsp:Transcript_61089/g.120980  ORF Transcript_61089/g.120980 Transcript_61089/m.120980 type:complete len:102 (-) Transcript_61089:49-354(-)
MFPAPSKHALPTPPQLVSGPPTQQPVSEGPEPTPQPGFAWTVVPVPVIPGLAFPYAFAYVVPEGPQQLPLPATTRVVPIPAPLPGIPPPTYAPPPGIPPAA